MRAGGGLFWRAGAARRPPERFALHGAGLDPVTRRRARHVVGENERVLQAAAAMRAGDAGALGALMNASQASLRDDFEVSSAALDAMASCAQAQPGVYGARMTGGGFAGCAVALVEAARAEAVADAVRACYVATTGVEPAIYITEASAGASVITP